MVIAVQDILFEVDVFYLLVLQDKIFADALHRVQFIVLLVLNDVDFTEGAATNHLLDVEIGELGIWIGSIHDCLRRTRHRLHNFCLALTILLITIRRG